MLVDPKQPADSDRRSFIKVAGAMSAASALALTSTPSFADDNASDSPETRVQQLFGSMTEEQKEIVCFDWNHVDPRHGLLRTRLVNNWHITNPVINSDFYSGEQQSLIREIFEGIIVPDWHERYDKQLQDDGGGFGKSHNIAIFGTPGDDKFEFVFTGRHVTLRCDGNSAEHVAFGGPIFYGHAAEGFHESAQHRGNVFWEQALAANRIYDMLDGRQRGLAEVDDSPAEHAVAFQGPEGEFPGIPLAEMSADQVEEVANVLAKLLEPYRQNDRDETIACIAAQGGLEKCSLAFYTDDDLGDDKIWDNWRLEGPSLVWYFRGSPHVHSWVNIADDPGVELNT